MFTWSIISKTFQQFSCWIVMYMTHIKLIHPMRFYGYYLYFNKNKNMTKYFILKSWISVKNLPPKVEYALFLFIKHKVKIKIYFLFRALSKTTELGLKAVSLFWHTLHSTLPQELLLFFFFFEIRVSRQYLSSTSKVTKFCLRQVVGLY